MYERHIRDFHRKFRIDYDGAPRMLPRGTSGFHSGVPVLLRSISAALRHARDIAREAPADDLESFRIGFLIEELHEYVEACIKNDQAHAFDALVDLAYVLFGTSHLHGFPFGIGWITVHRANMAKERCRLDEVTAAKRGSAYDVVKPEGWEPPDLAAVLDAKRRQLQYVLARCPLCRARDEYPLTNVPQPCTNNCGHHFDVEENLDADAS